MTNLVSPIWGPSRRRISWLSTKRNASRSALSDGVLESRIAPVWAVRKTSALLAPRVIWKFIDENFWKINLRHLIRKINFRFLWIYSHLLHRLHDSFWVPSRRRISWLSRPPGAPRRALSDGVLESWMARETTKPKPPYCRRPGSHLLIIIRWCLKLICKLKSWFITYKY